MVLPTTSISGSRMPILFSHTSLLKCAEESPILSCPSVSPYSADIMLSIDLQLRRMGRVSFASCTQPVGSRSVAAAQYVFLQVSEEICRVPTTGVQWYCTSGTTLGCGPIVHFGTDEQRERFLAPATRGEARFCLGVTEPEGSEMSSVTTRTPFPHTLTRWF